MIFLFFPFCISIYKSISNDSSKEFVLNEQNCFSDETIITSCSNYQQSVTLTNCIFDSFQCSENGGALHFNFSSSDQICTIECCKFNRCSSDIGGAIYCKSSENVNITFNNCIFESNVASILGGAIYFFHFISNFHECQFINNTVINNTSAHGGAIYFMRSSTYITSCIFNNNVANMFDYGIAYGGALHIAVSALEIAKTDFINNSVVSDDYCQGGAICIEKTSGSFYECNFLNNTLYCNGLSSRMYAAAVGTPQNLGEEINFHFCSFINNTSKNSETSSDILLYGGILYLNKCKVMEECNFINNMVFLHGTSSTTDGLFYFPSSINISSCNFSNNSFVFELSSSISVVMMKLSSADCSNCIFFNNTATSLDDL